MSRKEFLGIICRNCGKGMYTKHAVCPNCRGRQFEEFELGDQGVLLTFTKLYAVPEGVEQIPLTLGIVEFPGGMKVTGQIVADEVKIGDKLRPIWGALRKVQGKEVYGFKFQPFK